MDATIESRIQIDVNERETYFRELLSNLKDPTGLWLHDEIAFIQLFKELLAFLVSINSINFNNEKEVIIRYVLKLLEFPSSEGIFEIHTYTHNKTNPVILLKSKGKSSSGNIIHSHLDVVANPKEDGVIDWNSLNVSENMAYGRGVNDMKYSLALIIMSLYKMAHLKEVLPNDVAVLLTTDEEISNFLSTDDIYAALTTFNNISVFYDPEPLLYGHYADEIYPNIMFLVDMCDWTDSIEQYKNLINKMELTLLPLISQYINENHPGFDIQLKFFYTDKFYGVSLLPNNSMDVENFNELYSYLDLKRLKEWILSVAKDMDDITIEFKEGIQRLVKNKPKLEEIMKQYFPIDQIPTRQSTITEITLSRDRSVAVNNNFASTSTIMKNLLPGKIQNILLGAGVSEHNRHWLEGLNLNEIYRVYLFIQAFIQGKINLES